MAMRFGHLALGLMLLELAAPAAIAGEPATAAPAAASDVDADPDGSRFQVEAERRKVVAANLTLTAAEAAALWPAYDEYRAAMHVLDARHLAVLARYADATKSGTLSDDQATKMLDELLATGVERATTRKEWRGRFAKVLPARKVVALYQLENRLDAVATLAVASQLPLAR